MHWHLNVPVAFASSCVCGRAGCGYVDSKQIHLYCPIHMPEMRKPVISSPRGNGKSAHLNRDCPGRP